MFYLSTLPVNVRLSAITKSGERVFFQSSTGWDHYTHIRTNQQNQLWFFLNVFYDVKCQHTFTHSRIYVCIHEASLLLFFCILCSSVSFALSISFSVFFHQFHVKISIIYWSDWNACVPVLVDYLFDIAGKVSWCLYVCIHTFGGRVCVCVLRGREIYHKWSYAGISNWLFMHLISTHKYQSNNNKINKKRETSTHGVFRNMPSVWLWTWFFNGFRSVLDQSRNDCPSVWMVVFSIELFILFVVFLIFF